jgi:hypothetical protein
MLEPFVDYLRAIEIPSTLQERAEYLCREFDLQIGNIDHLFVTDGYDNENIRRYKSVMLVEGHMMYEFQEFVVTEHIDIVNMRTMAISLLDVVKEHVEIPSGITSPNSRMQVTIHFSGGTNYIALEAVHNNCVYLWNFLKKVIVPHLKGGGGEIAG